MMIKEIEVESTLPQDWLFSLLQESWAQTKCSEDRNRNAPGVKSNKFKSDKLCLNIFRRVSCSKYQYILSPRELKVN